MERQTLQTLFVDQIRDLYDAEKQLVKALPKLAKAADSEELSEAIRNHLEATQNHIARLDQVFEIAGIQAKGKPCKAMKGLIEEGSEALQEKDDGVLRDLAIIAGAQRVEHYEMSAYGTARTIAEQLGLDDAVELLQETEDEEKEADSKLSKVAMNLYESTGEEEEETATAQADTEGEMETAGSPRSANKPKNTRRR